MIKTETYQIPDYHDEQYKQPCQEVAEYYTKM